VVGLWGGARIGRSVSTLGTVRSESTADGGATPAGGRAGYGRLAFEKAGGTAHPPVGVGARPGGVRGRMGDMVGRTDLCVVSRLRLLVAYCPRNIRWRWVLGVGPELNPCVSV